MIHPLMAASDVDAIVASQPRGTRARRWPGWSSWVDEEAREGRFAYGAPSSTGAGSISAHRKKAELEDARWGSRRVRRGRIQRAGAGLWANLAAHHLSWSARGFGVAAAWNGGPTAFSTTICSSPEHSADEKHRRSIHLVVAPERHYREPGDAPAGFPDAIIRRGTFSVYVPDPVQKIQMIFLANCRDLTTTTQCPLSPGRVAERPPARRRTWRAVRLVGARVVPTPRCGATEIA